MSTSSSLDAGTKHGSTDNQTEHARTNDSTMTPAVQFDEHNLRASTSSHRDAHGAPGSPSGAGKSHMSSDKKATASSSSLRQNNALRNSSSRNSLGGQGSSNLRRSKMNPNVVTRPAWARDDSVSPPASPTVGTRSPAPDREGADDAGESSHKGHKHTHSKSRGNNEDDAWVGLTTTRETAEEAEKNEAQSSNPDRWWTFTLPQKYRTKLLEHHLRMAFHHERSRNNTAKNDDEGSDAGKGRDSRPAKKRRSSEALSDGRRDSDDGSDTEMNEMRGRRRRTSDRQSEHGLGTEHWHGVAAGIGASGLLRNHDSTRSAKSRDQHRQDSPSPDGTSTTKIDNGDLEKQMKSDNDRYPTMSFRARLEHPDVYTVRQPATPGWASPWKPEERGQGFEVGEHRFGPSGFFPRTESGQKDGQKSNPWYEAWKNFLIHNPFVPLLFRSINIAFTTATLAVAAKLLIVLRNQSATDAVGASPLVAIIFAPLSLAHIVFQIWLEYFGRPIGLWTVQSKLSYTVVELVFICLWSAELSLCFDNYFTSTLICSPYTSPYIGPREPPSGQASPLNDPSRQPYLCRLQGSLIGLVFVSLLAYIIVLTVSLFRIFVRVSGGRR